jgi:large conductance mechanosensitive channel
MSILNEFKTFALKGNVVDLAVGVMIGAAFGKLVDSLVRDMLTPPIGFLLGGVHFSELNVTLHLPGHHPLTGQPFAAVPIRCGEFLQAVFDFFLIAWCLFLVVRVMNRLRGQPAPPPPPPPEPTPTEKLLAEIRDLLKDRNETRESPNPHPERDS